MTTILTTPAARTDHRLVTLWALVRTLRQVADEFHDEEDDYDRLSEESQEDVSAVAGDLPPLVWMLAQIEDRIGAVCPPSREQRAEELSAELIRLLDGR